VCHASDASFSSSRYSTARSCTSSAGWLASGSRKYHPCHQRAIDARCITTLPIDCISMRPPLVQHIRKLLAC
jgi:hypothetical protein